VLLFCSSAWADNKSIEGTVTGTDGKPLPNAEIRAERLDANAGFVVTNTDAKGHYSFKSVPAGAYAITAIVKRVPKSRASVRTGKDGRARVDFDLRRSADGKKIAGKPSGRAANSLDADNLSREQRSLGGNINSMSFPGH
jgi:hypothetical protein